MFITKKHLPRRTFLRGVGATLALPLLDAMVPALTLLAQTAAKPAPRLGFVYVPHGAIMDKWTPATEGAGFEFTPILKPLEPFRDRLNVVSGLGHRAADTTAVHSLEPDDVAERRASEADPGRRRVRRRHRRPDRRAGDRSGHAAAVDGAGDRGSLRPDRLLRPRLRLHLHEHAVVAHADDADADGDQSAQGVRADVRPGRQRDRARSRASQEDRSILDAITQEAAEPAARSSAPQDRQTMTQYLENVREIERRIQRAETQPGRRRSASCRRRRPAFRSTTKSTSS